MKQKYIFTMLVYWVQKSRNHVFYLLHVKSKADEGQAEWTMDRWTTSAKHKSAP